MLGVAPHGNAGQGAQRVLIGYLTEKGIEFLESSMKMPVKPGGWSTVGGAFQTARGTKDRSTGGTPAPRLQVPHVRGRQMAPLLPFPYWRAFRPLICDYRQVARPPQTLRLT